MVNTAYRGEAVMSEGRTHPAFWRCSAVVTVLAMVDREEGGRWRGRKSVCRRDREEEE